MGTTARVALAWTLLAGCGDNLAPPATAKDARVIDASTVDTPTDAPVLPACATPARGTTLRVRRIGNVNGFATFATAPRGDRRLFVLERGGAIRIFDADRVLLPDPFLDLSEDAGGPVLATSNETGLLGLAFHPEYAANGVFYVYYTRTAIPTETKNPLRDVVARCRRSTADENRAEPTCEEILAIKDPFVNHNGGMLEFGADGYLYISTGDGGSGGDPRSNAQALVDGQGHPDSVALLGKILRIDVDHPDAGRAYGIPADNPFASGGGAPEIFALGLRNPWRWSFDPATGDAWIGDVGQARVEEVDLVRAGELRGKNFGWDMWEGSSCFTPPCTMEGMTFPQIERTHPPPPTGDGWSAVIGGSVYRGTCYPDLVGTYIFANFGFRTLTKATVGAGGAITTVEQSAVVGETPFPPGPTSISPDAFGELYITTTGAGAVFKLEAHE